LTPADEAILRFLAKVRAALVDSLQYCDGKGAVCRGKKGNRTC
jgi:hypothetical protein